MAAAGVATDSHNHSKSAFLAGGTTLLDLMKLDVMQPDAVIDINPLAEAGNGRIELSQHGLRLGALVRMSDAADHPGIRSGYPVVAQSLAGVTGMCGPMTVFTGLAAGPDGTLYVAANGEGSVLAIRPA